MSDSNELDWALRLQEDQLLSILLPNNNGEQDFDLENYEDLIKLAHVHIDPQCTIDEIGKSQLPLAIDGEVNYIAWPDYYWNHLKREITNFICTKDKRYSNLRAKLSDSANKSQKEIVSTISAALASQLVVVAGVLAPFVALCLVVLVRTGIEEFCNSTEWNMPLKSEDGNKSQGKA